MRIIRYQTPNNETHHGIQTSPNHATRLQADPIHHGVQPTDTIDTVERLLAPLTPPNIFCIGQNYRRHAEETGAPIPTQPVIFMKPTTAIQNPAEPVAIPACNTHGDEVDYEVELAVIIGKPTRNATEDNALDHVFGYTVANDISARRWQKHAGGGQWIRGKSFDTFCPLGPAILTADEIPDPQALHLTTTLNNQTLQDSNTADMIFPVKTLIAFLSQDTTLLPGTLILTGTPEGVGFTRKPPIFLQPGDTVTATVEPIGGLTNPITTAI
ncbi:fumarylacetoacetate hydrolase family protein [Mucisphaera sp.]|uniref:fumarylacetoacetate hydrolase family protein n=1 Tax=Mucisphaera sp. TaxID=2913024 RepID=UPI003D0B7532